MPRTIKADITQGLATIAQPPELLTSGDMLTLLRVGEKTLQRLARQPGFPVAIKISTGGTRPSLRWRRTEVEAWLLKAQQG